MQNLPDKVRETYNTLKKSLTFSTRLQVNNGRYYVYKQLTIWDKNAKKGKSQAKYLGKILRDGTFVRKINQNTDDLDIAKAIIIAHGGTVKLPLVVKPEEVTKPTILEDTDKIILTNLSMNCRMPISEIAKRAGITTTATIYKKRNLEKKFGIRYLSSINIHSLGFSYYIAWVKYDGKKPNINELKTAIEKEKRAQLALLTTGKYDMLLYIVAENDEELNNVIFRIHNCDALKNCISSWMASVYVDEYGYVPLRDDFFELIKDKVWHKTKDTPRPKQNQILKSEYAVLRELNTDGNISFSKIDEKYDLNKGNARYTYERLKEKHIYAHESLQNRRTLLRNTLTMRNLDIKYDAIVIMEILNSKEFQQCEESLFYYVIKDTDRNIVNRFSAMGDITTPYGMLFITPIFNENELENISEELNERIKGVKFETLIVTDVLIGSLSYRRFDNTHSRQYAELIRLYKMEPKSKLINYEASKLEKRTNEEIEL